MIRNAVLYNHPRPTPPDDADQRAEFIAAMRVITEYNLHTDGITYTMQGYRTAEGDVPARKLDEYLLCKRLYNQAYADLKARQKR